MNRLEHKPAEFVAIALPTMVYIGVKDREKFESLALPCTDFGENDKGHVLVKKLEKDGVTVIFQYWIKSLTIDAILADGEARARREAQGELGIEP